MPQKKFIRHEMIGPYVRDEFDEKLREKLHDLQSGGGTVTDIKFAVSEDSDGLRLIAVVL